MTHTDSNPLLWAPSAAQIENSRLTDYTKWLKSHLNLEFQDYAALWQWSATAPADFWASIWQYFNIESTPYKTVMGTEPMPHARWFEGAQLNYAAHIFRAASDERPALQFASERQPLTAISWATLRQEVAAFAHFLRQRGIGQGDRVVAYMPNVPQAVVAFLATAAVGAVWSSCSPDFGTDSVVERFQQIEPKLLLAVDGYQYGGKPFDRRQVVVEIAAQLPTVETLVWVPYLEAEREDMPFFKEKTSFLWQKLMDTEGGALVFAPVPFDHPLYILYSSGTTGKPKAITHGHGGILLEHLKYLAFHNDVKPGETFFWYATTGWMMWNFAVSALLHGATVCLYDGSPTYPDIRVLWNMAAAAPIHHFGTSAPYLVACQKAGLDLIEAQPLPQLRSIGSTGSPLPPEAYTYVYAHLKKDVWLASMSGGTDVCTAWIGGQPWAPVYVGELQARCLGAAMYSYDELGQPVEEAVGEMVVTQPMPSMPIYFWNDTDFSQYKSAYFEMFPGIWRHGDWLKITARGTGIIYGRSDATLNRQGIRIGTAEIYRVVEQVVGVKDALIVNLELKGGRHFMPLFVVVADGHTLDDALRQAINQALRQAYSPRHVPDAIIEVSDIPYTISGKKMEAPVKKVLMGLPLEKSVNIGAMRQPSAIDFFVAYAETFADERSL